jgi:SAM-dependent methyltransferase
MTPALRVPLCRSCGAALSTVFADLGLSPIANAFVEPDHQDRPETFYPLKALVCDACFLVQLGNVQAPETHFHDRYAYFSSFSESWLSHAQRFAAMALERFRLGSGSLVVEVGSNDGYLLQYFVQRGIPVLGIDPAANCAETAWTERRVRTEVAFFGAGTAERLRAQGVAADVLIANNVLAHVPDIGDFLAGFKTLLRSEGTASFEFPHLLELIRHQQFDTVYHEHYSYLSLVALRPLLSRAGLRAFDVERLPTHGGSLRLFVCHAEDGRVATPALRALEDEETAAELTERGTYLGFEQRIVAVKRDLLEILIALKREGRRIAAYGAPAKGNTLLNFCGIGTDFVDFTVDRNVSKQGLLLPGSRIPILAPGAIFERKPDFVLILPWNLSQEIRDQLRGISAWGGRFILPIPTPAIVG